MLLTLDLGNSTLDACAHAPGGPRRAVWPAPGADALAAWLPEGIERVVVASVVEAALAPVAAALADRGLRVERAGADLPCPLELAYARPERLGVDRWVAALGAHRLVGGAAIVVDAGSATTVDVVDAAGRFLGGAIAPGLRALAGGLARAAPALPAAAVDGALEVPAVDTEAAVSAGVLASFVGGVALLVDEQRRRTGLTAAPVLLTGGDAAVLARLAATRPQALADARVVDDLVHRGLAALAAAAAP